MSWSNSDFISTKLSKVFAEKISKTYPQLTADQVQDCLEIVPAKSTQHGHYQCNSCFKLAKLVHDKPIQIAQKLLPVNDPIIAHCEIAGGGFINVTLETTYLEQSLQSLTTDLRLGIKATAKPKKIIIDFSSPNTAKELHVGHLRSTIIGDMLSRLFEFLGHHVLRLNHIGDWGTPFGMLIEYLKTKHLDVLSGKKQAELSDLARWYKEARKCFDEDDAFRTQSQQQVIQLQAKEPEAMKAWNLICEISRQGYQKIYDLLDVKITERGESYYHDFLPKIVALFKSKNLTQVSDHALCVFLDHFVTKEGTPLPLIIQKSDGGYNYETTDLAALYQRITVEKADRIIYVVDNGQSQHFQMVFQAAKLAGYYDPAKVQVDHVPFGLVLGEDGKKYKTRSGDSEKLIDLLENGILKAASILNERSSQLAHPEKTARILGINAIKYADLSCLRTKDYVFSYDKMLQFEGNTAAFLLYAYVRICSIQEKAHFKINDHLQDLVVLKEPTEILIALHLLQLKEVLESIATSLLPNRLCEYLYQLAEKFHAFFRDCPVINSEYQNSRLLLCHLVKQAFEIGFEILGLKTVTRM